MKDNLIETWFKPYQVHGCTEIPHCKDGGKLVNHCEVCDDGYVWEYDDTKKSILFDKCILLFDNGGDDEAPMPYQLLSCLAKSPNKGNSGCSICKKGYYLFNGDCEKIKIPYCLNDYTVFEE